MSFDFSPCDFCLFFGDESECPLVFGGFVSECDHFSIFDIQEVLEK